MSLPKARDLIQSKRTSTLFRNATCLVKYTLRHCGGVLSAPVWKHCWAIGRGKVLCKGGEGGGGLPEPNRPIHHAEN